MALPGAGVLAGPAGRLRRLSALRGRFRKDNRETSFLESRLQPDSFFGASGGQRVDTRDAPARASSSMSYSLSQLDAIGDVDPVAEADVYLAYGRDLQAEEILKEAMRGNPDRLAIRTKLLEVYAKRRDTKGFELLATQLYALTKGEGDDWAKAQELGRQIDPENPLYTAGRSACHARGRRRAPGRAAGCQHDAAVGAVDQAHWRPGSPTWRGRHRSDRRSRPRPATWTGRTSSDSRAAGRAGSDAAAGHAPAPRSPTTTTCLDRPADAAPGPAPAAERAARRFDWTSTWRIWTLRRRQGPRLPRPARWPDGLRPSLPPSTSSDDGDPLARKLELAEEFRQIGDMEGARDLLEEVVAKAGGALKTKAQSMLDSLG